MGTPPHLIDVLEAAEGAVRDLLPDRESVARVLNPVAWQAYDAMMATYPEDPMNPMIVEDSLAKADAVLALMPGRSAPDSQPTPEASCEEEEEMSREEYDQIRAGEHAARQDMHQVLLRIWRAVTPDSEYSDFGPDPEVVWDSIRTRLTD